MGFKIGDKVRIHNCEGNLRYNGMIGTVIETGRIKSIGHSRWDYLCEFDDIDNYPFGLREMKRVITKGEQLQFSFMEQ